MNKLDNMHKPLTQVERNKRYEQRAEITQFKLNLKPTEQNIIDTLAEMVRLNKKATILAACKYCIDNNINLTATDSRAEDK